MDIKDLMLGDWVKPEHFRPGRVSYLSAERGCIECLTGPEEDEDDDYEGYLAFWPEGFEPIPLTREILETNGFEKYDNLWQSPKEAGIILDLEECDTTWYRVKNTLMELLYVHQLQHALRLCGLNDIADNFKVEQI